MFSSKVMDAAIHHSFLMSLCYAFLSPSLPLFAKQPLFYLCHYRLKVLELHINGILQFVLSLFWLLLLNIIILRLIHA
jgi:hypothetical protein